MEAQNQTKYQKHENELIVPVNKIIPNINATRLTSLEDIEQGKVKTYEYAEEGEHGNAIYDECLEPVFRKVIKIPYFKDQIVVDLGSCNGLGYKAVRFADAKAYIGVEPHSPGSTLRGIKQGIKNERFRGRKRTLASVVNDDMLTFLKRLPNDSVSVLMTGIDNFIINNDNYRHEVRDEITRVLHPAGCYVSDWESSIYPKREMVKDISDDFEKPNEHSLLRTLVKNMNRLRVFIKDSGEQK